MSSANQRTERYSEQCNPSLNKLYNQTNSRAVTLSSLEREVWGSNVGPVKSDTVLPTARHLCDISSQEAVFPGRNDAEMGPANSLHTPAYYSEYNERIDLIWFINNR